MYGMKPALGVARLNLPDEVATKLATEEELAEALGVAADSTDIEGPSAVDPPTTLCTTCEKSGATLELDGILKLKWQAYDLCINIDETLCDLCAKSRLIASEQESASQHQQKQAEKMKTRSSQRLGTAEVGTTVMVPIPYVDRGRAEFPNIKAVVLEVNNYGLYKLGTKHGVLHPMYARNQFTVCAEKFLSIEEVPREKTVSLRQVAKADSMGTGQGFKHCSCKKECDSARCACFKANLLCNSKCHAERMCKNKH